jgi:transcriptional regulator with XRE-family HTH domain
MLDTKTGLQLKADIVRRGLKQREVAHAIGVRPDDFSKLLRGDRAPRPGELSRVADAIVSLSSVRS